MPRLIRYVFDHVAQGENRIRTVQCLTNSQYRGTEVQKSSEYICTECVCASRHPCNNRGERKTVSLFSIIFNRATR